MRKISLLILALVAPLMVAAQSNYALWYFPKKANDNTKSYTETGIYPAAAGIDGATLRFCHKGKPTTPALTEKGFPTASTKRGDYWLFTVPVESLAAGSVVDVFIPFAAAEGKRERFALEYRDGSRWRSGATVTSTPSLKHIRRLWHSVRLSRAIEGGAIELRLRKTERSKSAVTIASSSAHGQQPQVTILDNTTPRDTLKMLFLGNSYTYYHTYPLIFKEIAWREGHYTDCDIFISGGYTMAQHLANPQSVEYVDRGGYDYIMLQDQSVLPLLNGTADDAKMTENIAAMAERARKSSKDIKVMVEITWGRRFGNNNLGQYEKYAEKYPQFFTDYDTMQNRLIENITAEATACGAAIHPLGVAWQIVMHERPDINLYHTDNHHQSYAGSYLSAAVAYLAVYGEKFGKNPANCKLDAQTAAYLRSVAERVVLGGEKWSEK